MTLGEKIFGNSIGAFVQYGKTDGGVLKALLTDADGKLQVSMAADADLATMQDDIALIKADIAAIRAILES
jgi:hypothetical protein